MDETPFSDFTASTPPYQTPIRLDDKYNTFLDIGLHDVAPLSTQPFISLDALLSGIGNGCLLWTDQVARIIREQDIC